MIGLLVALFLLWCIFGRTRGLLGGLAGGFIGALVLTGMARTAASGDLPALYSPGQLASSALLMATVAAVLALVSPYAIGLAACAWGAGALLATLALPWTDQGMYALACIVHVFAALAVGCLARWRAAAELPGPGWSSGQHAWSRAHQRGFLR
jgi:hypothetical protein